MTMIDRLDAWQAGGVITDGQHGLLSALVRKDRFSVYLELSAILYLGVLFFVGGVGWTVREHVDDLGDGVIIAALTAMAAAAFYYCSTRGEPYDRHEVESPHLAFDFVLYLGCLLLSAEVTYLQYRFEIFRSWHHHLLIGALVFGGLAYRFDNRFVLSMALSTLAAWLGLRLSDGGETLTNVLRFTALGYGAFLAGIGTWLHRQDIKAHFLDTYLHVAANIALLALLSGLDEPGIWPAYLAALVALSAAAIMLGIRHRRFAFVAYGTLYGYAGVSFRLLDEFGDPIAAMLYFIVTGSLVIGALVVVARKVGREE